jgi:nucleoside-diphosphate-sugar epimerase
MEVWRGIAEGLDAVMINPGVILGYGDYGKGSLSIVRKVAAGMPVYPRGSNAYVDARDVAKALIQLSGKPDHAGQRFIAISENLSYRDLFTGLAVCLGKRPPFIKAGLLLCSAAWLGSSLFARLRGTEAYVTRDLVRTAVNSFGYDSSRLKEALGFAFTPIQKTIQDSCRGYQEWENEMKG